MSSTIEWASGFVSRCSFYHYRIDRLLNGNVTLSGSRAQEKFALSNDDTKPNNSRTSTKESDQMEFPGPMDLISHFQKKADLLVTTLAIPCQRPYVSVLSPSRRASRYHTSPPLLSSKNHNFIQFWCAPLLTPELYVNKIFQEASSTDLEVTLSRKDACDLTGACTHLT